MIHSWCVYTLWAIISNFPKAVISTNIDFSLIRSYLVLPSRVLNKLTVTTKKKSSYLGGKQEVQNLSVLPCFPQISLLPLEGGNLKVGRGAECCTHAMCWGAEVGMEAGDTAQSPAQTNGPQALLVVFPRAVVGVSCLFLKIEE